MSRDYQPNLRVFGVLPADPGYIYIIRHQHQYKIGRSKNKHSRIKEAKTWIPDMDLVGIKPFWNIKLIERKFHEGFADCWYAGEWFEFGEECDRDLLVGGFSGFSDTNRDMNSVDFIYWYNSSGLSEFAIERREQGLTLPAFLRKQTA